MRTQRTQRADRDSHQNTSYLMVDLIDWLIEMHTVFKAVSTQSVTLALFDRYVISDRDLQSDVT